jgi:enoyl-CoA hydratase/carnithine racemase
VVLLSGAGRGFCTGLDIKEVVDGGDRLLGDDGCDTLEPRLFGLIPLMRNCPQPIIALINGAAAGAGFAIALASDVRIAARGARLMATFTSIGLSGCELGVSYFLPRIVGLGIATELLYTSRTVDARRAQAIGLVSEVVAANELESAGRAMAEDMLKATPLGLRRTKEIFNLCLGVADLDAVLKIEELTQFKLYKTEEMKARMEVFAGPGYSIR